MAEVVALGELLIDFTCTGTGKDGYPEMAAHPGGAPSNFLAALAKLGSKTALIGKVGQDAFGSLLLTTMRDAEIETRGIAVDSRVFTTLAFVTLDETGDRTFSFARKPGADTCLTAEEVDLGLIEDAKVFHFGTLSLTDDPSRSATRHAVDAAKRMGKLISFDPNLRKPLWNNLEDAKTQMLWGLRQSDVVKISDEEVRFLFDLDAEEAAEHIAEACGVKLVFVTCGKDGCVFQNAKSKGRVPALSGIETVDTTGAGDIFGGSAMWKLLQIGKAPEELNAKELVEIAGFACVSAGLSTTKSGGISSIATPSEIAEAMNAYAQKNL